MTKSLKIALKAVDDKKAIDIVVIDISKVASFANYFLICTGESSRQIQAIADEVEAKLKAEGERPGHIEGFRNAEWVLMDYADIVVHIFSKNARVYYDLERLWRDGKRLDVQKLLEPAPRKATTRKRSASS
jgi:ribosome-associated protein